MRGATLFAAVLFAAIAAPAAAETRAEAFAKLPYWDGQWLTENNTTSIGGFGDAQIAAQVGEEAKAVNRSLWGFDAPWNEEGKRRVAERMKLPPRKADGWGYPMMMNGAPPIQFLITPEEVLVINAYRDVRHIRTDGKGHPSEDDLWPTVWGDSVGHWEGDTLVVDTIAVTNPNHYFHSAPTLSEEAHYVERIRMVSPDRIELEITITDPVTLTGPWTNSIAYVRAEGFDRMIHEDYSNDRTQYDENGGTILTAPEE